ITMRKHQISSSLMYMMFVCQCSFGFAGKEYKHKPSKPNEHWHTNIMYIKELEIWYFLIVILDGYSRYVVGWKVLLDMTSQSVSLFMQEVIDENPSNGVKLIHDNGSQLISYDFKKVLMAGNIQQICIIILRAMVKSKDSTALSDKIVFVPTAPSVSLKLKKLSLVTLTTIITTDFTQLLIL
ncbi:MAG: transposase family protein, partial [Nitrospirota bacterium]